MHSDYHTVQSSSCLLISATEFQFQKECFPSYVSVTRCVVLTLKGFRGGVPCKRAECLHACWSACHSLHKSHGMWPISSKGQRLSVAKMELS